MIQLKKNTKIKKKIKKCIHTHIYTSMHVYKNDAVIFAFNHKWTLYYTYSTRHITAAFVCLKKHFF